MHPLTHTLSARKTSCPPPSLMVGDLSRSHSHIFTLFLTGLRQRDRMPLPSPTSGGVPDVQRLAAFLTPPHTHTHTQTLSLSHTRMHTHTVTPSHTQACACETSCPYLPGASLTSKEHCPRRPTALQRSHTRGAAARWLCRRQVTTHRNHLVHVYSYRMPKQPAAIAHKGGCCSMAEQAPGQGNVIDRAHRYCCDFAQ